MLLPEAISQLTARSSEWRDLLISWANQNSGSSSPAGLEAMREILAKRFSVFGEPEAVTLPGSAARAVRIRFRPNAPHQVLFSGHFDTVYDADHSFQRCELLDADTLRGPGVADMKGGLVILFAALQAFEKLPQAHHVGGEIFLTPDEEIGSVASRPFLEEAARRYHFGLVFEPCRTNGDLVRARMGTGMFTAKCRGRAAHAGRAPEQGRNAIVALAEFLPLADALNRELPNILINVGRIQGGGAANIVPDAAEAELNIRVARMADADLVLQRLRALAAPINAREGYALTIEGKFNRGPKEVTAADQALFQGWSEAAKACGFNAGWQDVAGGSDGNLLSAAGLPNLDGLGAWGGGMHSPTEYIKLSSLPQRAQGTALFLHRLALRQWRLGG
jgi:glutamate carboxypeptidase